MNTGIPWTWDEILKAFAIVIAIILFVCAAIYSIGKAMETLRGWRKPQTDIKKTVEEHEKRLCSGNERFERQDNMIGALQEGQRVTCIGLQALLNSALYGNNVTGIENAQSELNGYLTGAIVKK